VSSAHDDAAARLIEAARSRIPCAPVRDLFVEGTIDDGYAVQQLVAARTSAGRRLVGRKIGLTSSAVQSQMGVDTPDFGLLYEDMAFASGAAVTTPLLQPRAEAEIAFVLGADLDQLPVTPEGVRAATAGVAAAIEIVDSRIVDWDITIVDTVADNASSGAFVLGDDRVPLDAVPDLAVCEMTLTCEGEVVSTGAGEACLGHPLNAVTWLANAVGSRGAPLRAGEIVLSGSLGALVPMTPGRVYEAVISGLGSVRTILA
jgi:2-keto-4-pentenoate hydratase